MTLFARRNVLAAYRHAEAGGQAVYMRRNKTADRAWLIDHDVERLMATARRLGVRSVQVSRAFLPGQYIALTGGPLDRALVECRQPEMNL